MCEFLPLASVAGTRWTRCTPRLELQSGKDAISVDRGNNLLVSAKVIFGDVDNLDLPFAKLGVAAVHAEQVGCEKRRLVATRPGPHLDNDALVVGLVLRQIAGS